MESTVACYWVYSNIERMGAYRIGSIVGENCIRTREKERTGFVYRLMVKKSKAKEETLELHMVVSK